MVMSFHERGSAFAYPIQQVYELKFEIICLNMNESIAKCPLVQLIFKMTICCLLCSLKISNVAQNKKVVDDY